MSQSLRLNLFCGSMLLASGLSLSASADQTGAAETLVVSRVQYVAPTPAPDPFPQIFDDPNVSGVQGNSSTTTRLFLARRSSRPCR
jgi:hypothetical protein